MQEMPEYQICEKCGKRGTPNVKKCWNCGAFYPGFSSEDNVPVFTPNSSEDKEVEEKVIETIKPCEIEEMDFSKKIFAYGLLLGGEMELEFCECDICTKALSDLLAFIMECKSDDEIVKEEMEKIDRSEFRFDASAFTS